MNYQKSIKKSLKNSNPTIIVANEILIVNVNAIECFSMKQKLPTIIVDLVGGECQSVI